jgi:Na+-transporting NADH:ubiquinone oxidoreductase subunit NqrB
VAFAGTVYVNAAWWCWWFAGNSFGSRAFEATLLFFMGGLACLFVRSTPPWRKVLFSMAMLAVVWNFCLMAFFYGSVIDRNAPVTWTEMIQAGARMLSGSTLQRTP